MIHQVKIFIFLILLIFLSSFFNISCSTLENPISYKKDLIEIDIQSLPKIKMAAGKTVSCEKIWWNHKNELEKKLSIVNNLSILWKSSFNGDGMGMDLKGNYSFYSPSLNQKTDDILIFDFNCRISHDGRVDNIVLNKEDPNNNKSPILKYAMERAFKQNGLDIKPKTYYPMYVYQVIPFYTLNNLHPGDVFTVYRNNYSEYVPSMRNLETALIFKGISKHNGRTVIVFEIDEAYEGRLNGYQKGYYLIDYDTRCIIDLKTELLINKDQKTFFHLEREISTILKQ
ncbi:hypothetical protein [uncultured Desulfosarcina sp.]|uniref:hypothetical protein n=1 Tax=uncultured Desulfosarcina sp. TaxID=218289 RepID=UPI0029C816BE|nr:hypothetical protein [uncultured Desulfosarcina sp.]